MHTRAHTPSASASASLVAPRAATSSRRAPRLLLMGWIAARVSLRERSVEPRVQLLQRCAPTSHPSLPPLSKRANLSRLPGTCSTARKQSPLSLASLALTCPCSLHRHMRMRRKCWRSMPSPTTARRTMMLPPSASLPALPVTEPRAARSTGSVVDDGPIHRHSDRRCSASAHEPSSSQPRCDPQCREARPRAHGMSLAHR